MKLVNKTQQKEIISHLEVADSFWSRSKGLLGRTELQQNSALWIHRCNSIHTFFMKFTIDCVFVDKNLIVKSLNKNIPPWRLVPPVWGASSVIELSSGMIDQLQIQLGDELNVGT